MSDVLIRAFTTQLERTGPRGSPAGRCRTSVTADVVDMVDGRPQVYREGFRPGAFARQSGSTEPGVARRVGRSAPARRGRGPSGRSRAREEPDGLWGDAEVLRSRANDVEDLLQAGVKELSVEFRLAGPNHTETVDGIRWRTHAHLDAVALEPKGAYTGAEVMAFRAEMDDSRPAGSAAGGRPERAGRTPSEAGVEETARAARAAGGDRRPPRRPGGGRPTGRAAAGSGGGRAVRAAGGGPGAADPCLLTPGAGSSCCSGSGWRVRR